MLTALADSNAEPKNEANAMFERVHAQRQQLQCSGLAALAYFPAERAFLSRDEHTTDNRSGYWWWVVLWRWRVVGGE